MSAVMQAASTNQPLLDPTVDGEPRLDADPGPRLRDVVADLGHAAEQPVDRRSGDLATLVTHVAAHLPVGHPLRRFGPDDPVVVLVRALGALARTLPDLVVPEELAGSFTRPGAPGG